MVGLVVDMLGNECFVHHEGEAKFLLFSAEDAIVIWKVFSQLHNKLSAKLINRTDLINITYVQSQT